MKSFKSFTGRNDVMSRGPSEQFLKTHQVAQVLQVSVSTAKRWIDKGDMTSNRTLGKHRHVLAAEVLRFAKERGLSVFPATSTGARPSPYSSVDEFNDKSRTALIQALQNGDSLRTRSILQNLRDSGISAFSLADNTIRPIMRTIGHGWETGQIDVYQEHDATLILSSILTEFNLKLSRSLVEPAPLAIGAGVEGDPYSLALHLGELTLRELGWNVRNLGGNLPLESLSKAILRYQPRLVFLCLNGDTGIPEDALISQFRQLEKTISTSDGSGTRILLGGRAIPARLKESLTRIGLGDSLADLVNLAKQIAPPTSEWTSELA